MSLNIPIVSIHAPARGATHNKNNRDLTDFVSIHAPARGATLEEKQLILAKVVSIHAPARGATDTITKRRSKSWVSIHAPARGATPIKIVFAGIFKFQSTPLRGATIMVSMSFTIGGFQSTPLRGATSTSVSTQHGPLVSIHALREGRLHRIFTCKGSAAIHAPARGATDTITKKRSKSWVSIHARARGDLIGASTIPVVRCFNPRPCTRGDRRLGRIKRRKHVSIHACARGDISELKTLIHQGFQLRPARGDVFCDSVFLYDTGSNPRPARATP